VLGVGKKFGNENIWNDIIKEVDVNGDGEISYEEFKVMMQKFLSDGDSKKKD
jgi:Ca2+-binding EF-hand superfamily protein